MSVSYFTVLHPIIACETGNPFQFPISAISHASQLSTHPQLTDMATTILNSTWLYLCKYDIYSPSAAYTAETTSNYYGHPEDVVFFGPRPFPKGSRGNGTLFAYPGRGKDSDFEWAINTSGVGYGSSKTAIDFMMENKMRYFLYAWDSNITCTEVEAGGVGKPVLPTS